MRVKVWGARGSVPSPGPKMNRYGGNTSCVQLALDSGEDLILDAGTGIRTLGLDLATAPKVNILLTHLHLDHIQGLMFFGPAFRKDSEIVVWGPPSEEASLCDRIARYISAPLAPVEVRELPISFRDAEPMEWRIGPARVKALPVNHRGPTLGYRIEDGSTSLCYIPDHEPGIGTPLAQLDDDWISGFELARDASLLIHDCQYTDEEYPSHLGWGHCPLSDALEFARRTSARRVLLFHHDPLHTDEFLDRFAHEVGVRWGSEGGGAEQITLARERHEIALESTASEPAAAS
jgi:phosphoribosyl 1,2-cyclic phosphodiesterase